MNFSKSFNLFKIVFLLLLMVTLARSLSGSDSVFTFRSLLEAFQNAPVVDVEWVHTFADWTSSISDIPIFGAVFSFLGSLVSVVIYGVNGIIQVIRYVIYIAGYLFI